MEERVQEKREFLERRRVWEGEGLKNWATNKEEYKKFPSWSKVLSSPLYIWFMRLEKILERKTWENVLKLLDTKNGEKFLELTIYLLISPHLPPGLLASKFSTETLDAGTSSPSAILNILLRSMEESRTNHDILSEVAQYACKVYDSKRGGMMNLFSALSRINNLVVQKAPSLKSFLFEP
jgi:hypothetical protein